jgi:two-component system, NtrC family, C4-dicarboxylate transport sensor histidine kinase DctB
MLRLKFILSFVAIFSFVVYLNSVNKHSLIENELNEATKTLQTHFDITGSYNRRDAKSINLFMSQNKKLYRILAEALDADEITRDVLRKELYLLLEAQYSAMRKRGVLQFQFVFPDSISFLRMHKPTKYGDYLGDIRHSLLNTNKTKKPSSGFEQGRTAHAFRNVFPLFNDEARYLGCYEISYTSEYMQNNLTNINKIHSHFLVNKNIFDAKTWKRKYLVLKYIPSIENSQYMFTVTNDSEKSQLTFSKKHLINPNREYITKNMEASNKFAIYQKVDNGVKVVAFLPIKNIRATKTVAYLVSYTDSKHIANILNIYYLINYFSFLVLAVILFLVYKTLLSRISMVEDLKRQKDEIIKKDKVLQEQSKLAAMGEMVGSIAHQWRQPLNSLNINIENLDDDYTDGLIDAKFIDKFIAKQTNTIQFMSHTIDDFRNFFRVDKVKKNFSVRVAIENIMSIQSAQLKNYNISIELSGEDFKLNAIESEFKQTILNIISNSKDAIIKTETPYGDIKIELKKDSIIISDNAGGIPQEILSRVFEPYFTTKSQGEGTGMGLYMSKMIIEKNMGGTLMVKNIKEGAEFTVTLKSAS